MVDDAAVAAIDDAVRTEMERARQPGLTLGLTDRDGTLLIRNYGFADLGSREPVTPDTLFEIGSIGKTFTAVATLQLVDEGRIDLHVPVARYLPWFVVPQPAGHAPITIAHLLSHTAGIVAGIDGTPEAAFQVWSLRDLPTSSAPGERFHYSNVGYKALGLVLEAVEGRPYREIIRARVLDPLQMLATEAAITHDIRARLAVGYEYLHDDRLSHSEAPLAPATWLETETADGSIASTAADMCAFVRLLMREGEGPQGRLLSEEAFAQMSTGNPGEDENDAYGYGLLMRNLEGRRFIGHGGGMVGYLAGMQADTNANLGAIVLQNGMGAHPMALARTAIRIADGEPAKSAGAAVTSTQDVLAGVYEPDTAGYEPIEIVASRNGPMLRCDGRETALEELEEDLFLAPDAAFDQFPIHVERSTDEIPELWHGGQRYVRTGTAARQLPEPSAEVQAFAGHYRSHNPWTTNFRIVVRGDQPWLIFAGAPDGFDTEQPLVPRDDGSFRVGDDPGNPEALRFDTVVDGRALRAWLSGWPYYRAG
ncbi:MAG: beta-lactamase family protein [Actinomycetota bacterium]|nr:beta-lactamase family protein [Actinomycetota bacterium]